MELLTEKDVLEKIHTPKALFRMLESYHHKSKDEDGSTLCDLFVSTTKQNNIDWLALASEAINEGFNAWVVFQIIEKIIPAIVSDIESGVKLIDLAISPTSRSSFPLNSFSEIAVESPQLAKQLLVKAKKVDDEYIGNCISALYLGLAENNIEQIHSEIINSLLDENVYTQRGMINCVARLSYQKENHSALIQKTVETLHGLHEVRGIAGSIAHAYGFLVDVSENAAKELTLLTKLYESDVDFQYHLSEVLFRVNKRFCTEEWLFELLNSLVTVSTECSQTLDYIDYTLSSLVGDDGAYEKVEGFVLCWIRESDYKRSSVVLTSIFPSAIPEVINRTASFSTFLLRLINHDDFVCHKAFSQIIRYCDERKFEEVVFKVSDISSLVDEDILFICRKIIAFVDSPKILCRLIYSMLQAGSLSKNSQEIVMSVFVTYIGENFSSTTMDFLEEKIDDSKESKELKALCQIMLEELESIHGKYRELQQLKELSYPNRGYIQILKANNKEMNRAMEEANKDSLVDKIATRIPLKYGKGWFNYHQGAYSERSDLVSFSHSIELPKSELLYPVHAAMQRFDFRRAKRGDK